MNRKGYSPLSVTGSASKMQAGTALRDEAICTKQKNAVLAACFTGHADVVALINSGGTAQATYTYDAFGVPLSSTGTAKNPIRYGGYEFDEETGYYYLKARFYDPKTARFLQEDTYRGNPTDPLSLNLYSYCSNNPVVYWDSTGHVRRSIDPSGSYHPDGSFTPKGVVNNGNTGTVSKEEMDNYYSNYSSGGSSSSNRSESDHNARVAFLQGIYGLTNGGGQQVKATNNPNAALKEKFFTITAETVAVGSPMEDYYVLRLVNPNSIFNPEVEMLLTQYEDLIVFTKTAYNNGIISKQEYDSVLWSTKHDIAELEKTNSVPKDPAVAIDTLTMIGGFVPGLSTASDFLGNYSTSYACDYTEAGLREISSNMDFIKKMLTKSGQIWTVYTLSDEKGVRYVGRTMQDIEKRAAQHKRHAPESKSFLKPKVAQMNGIKLENLTYWEARGFEELVFSEWVEKLGGYNGGADDRFLLNRIRAMSKSNKFADDYMKAAERFLIKALP